MFFSNLSPLQIAIQKGENDIVQILIKYGVKVNTKRRADTPPILFAIEAASKDESKMDSIVQCISTLIENNADINCSFLNGPNAGETPLISAARLGQVDLVKMLVDKKADVSAVSKSGKTAFYYAADKKNDELLKCLLAASRDPEADLNRKYDKGMSLVHVALQKIGNDFAAQDALKILQTLFENGVDPDSTDALGDTPLHIASKCDTAKNIVTLLIHKGCNPQQMNNSERTVFSVADKKMIPIIIKVSNEQESIEAMEERAEIKREREMEETENRIRNRDSQLITNTPSEYGEKKVDSKRKTQLIAMTKRGGSLRTPIHNKGTKYTPVKKMEARPWGGSKQAAKFQRDTRLAIRKIKEDVLEQLKKLREEVLDIQKKINVEAGNISESDHYDENEEDNFDNENDQDSFHNDLPPPETDLNNNQLNSSLNADNIEEEDQMQKQAQYDDNFNLQTQPQINNEDDELNLEQQNPLNEDENINLDMHDQEQQNLLNEDENINLDMHDQEQHSNNGEDNMDLGFQDQQQSHNDDDDLNLDLPDQQNSHNKDEIDLQTNDIQLNGEQNSNIDQDIDIDQILDGGSGPNIDIGE